MARRAGTKSIGSALPRVMKHTALTGLDEAVARTQALIEDQRARIDRIDTEGGDSSRHQEFLETFEALLAVQEARRQRARNRWRHVINWSRSPAVPALRGEVA